MTTSTLIAAGAHLLSQHPAQRAALEADPDRWPAAVEEMLRYVSPTTFTGARARVDVDVEGEWFEAGTHRVMFYAAANHDPRVFPDPDRFDITRQAKGHLAFSAGAQLLPGSPAGPHGSRDRAVHPVPPHPGTGHRPAHLAWQCPRPADRVPAQSQLNRPAGAALLLAQCRHPRRPTTLARSRTRQRRRAPVLRHAQNLTT